MKAQHHLLDTNNAELKSLISRLEQELIKEKAAKQVCSCGSEICPPQFFLVIMLQGHEMIEVSTASLAALGKNITLGQY